MGSGRLAKQPQEARGDGRSALLAAARALLSENSGSRFSLAKVASRSGKNVALVKYHFGGKEQMLQAILKEDQKALLGPLQKLAASDLPALEKLERHLSGMVELHTRFPYLTALTHELLRRSDDDTSREIANQIVRPVIEFQRSLLVQGKAEGVFRDVDPFAFYLNVVGGVDMLFSARATIEFGFRYHMDDQALRRRFVQETITLLTHGVTVQIGSAS